MFDLTPRLESLAILVSFLARYHANAITSLEMIQELIDMAKDLKASSERGDDLGLGEEELAFYDALAQSQSAVDVLGNEELRKIAHVLVEQLQKNVTVDWHLKESARAKLRVLVRRIRKKTWPSTRSGTCRREHRLVTGRNLIAVVISWG